MDKSKSQNRKQYNCFSQFFGNEDFSKMMKENCMNMKGCDCMAMMEKFSAFKENSKKKENGKSDEKNQ